MLQQAAPWCPGRKNAQGAPGDGHTSSVKRLDPQARVPRSEDRHTLDELLVAVRTKFPDALVSRSSIHRAGYEELVKGMRKPLPAWSSLSWAKTPTTKPGALF